MSFARAHERVRVQNVRDFPQTEPDREINAPFLLSEHVDPHSVLFHNFNEDNILHNWEKNYQKSMATFLANEMNTTERDTTGKIPHVQIVIPLKDKKLQGIWWHFFWDVDA